jgi:hypothetical protein
MIHNIIKTEDYLIVGNDNNSKRGWFYCFRTKNLFQDEGEDVLCCNGDMKIIAHLPLNGTPVLDGVDLLPSLENDVEKLAIEEVGIDGQIYNISDYESFIKGYIKAKERYKYSEEDIRKALYKMYSLFMSSDLKSKMEVLKKKEDISDKIIQSIQQPKYPIAFEFEFTKLKTKDLGNGFSEFKKPLQTEWIGKYLY